MTESNRKNRQEAIYLPGIHSHWLKVVRAIQEEQSQNDFFFEKVTVQLPQQIICCLPQ